MVVLGYYGFAFLKTEKLERYMHPIGGLTVSFADWEWFSWAGRHPRASPKVIDIKALRASAPLCIVMEF